MKLMKSGIEVDDQKQQKIKGGYCVCYCDIGFIPMGSERVGVAGDSCACTCSMEPWSSAQKRMKAY